eukprot:6186053-Pleurochrysis_carterae.AAC.1
MALHRKSQEMDQQAPSNDEKGGSLPGTYTDGTQEADSSTSSNISHLRLLAFGPAGCRNAYSCEAAHPTDQAPACGGE